MIGVIDGELDVADALSDKTKCMQSGCVILALLEVSIEREECREKIVWRCAVATTSAEVAVESTS